MRSFLLILLLASFCIAQEDSTDLAEVFEPAWQTEKARLFRVTLAPGQSTKALTHDRDWLLVTLSAGDVTLAPEQARSRRLQFEPGHIEIATTASPTVLRNSGGSEVSFFLLELAGGIRAKAAACGLGGNDCDSEYGNLSGPTYARATHFSTPTVQAVETTIDPEAVLDPHQHSFPFLFIALSDLELESSVEGGQSEKLALKAGDFRAFEGDFGHTIKNIGKSPARFLTLEVR